jgi:hypothetical protein
MNSEKSWRKTLLAAAAIAGVNATEPAQAQTDAKRPDKNMSRELGEMQQMLGGYVEKLPEGAQEFSKEKIKPFVPEKGSYLTDLIRKMIPDQKMQDYDASTEALFEPNKKVVFVEYEDAKGKFYYRYMMGRFQADIILHESKDARFKYNSLSNIRAIYVAPQHWIHRSK